MAPIADRKIESSFVTGTVQYLVGSVESSLYANGKVLTFRDPDGDSNGSRGVNLKPRSVQVRDARKLAGDDERTLERNGFELVHSPVKSQGHDFLDLQWVVDRYYDECAALVKEATGAWAVRAFDHNVRSAAGKDAQTRIAGGQHVQGPAQVVHGDYTLNSAPRRLRDLGRPPTTNDTYRHRLRPGEALLSKELVARALSEGGRFAIINVWRNVAPEPVVRYPMALCDAQSVDPEDLVVFEIHYQDRVGENYFAKPAVGHEWFFYPRMTSEEALLLKQWDSNGPMAQTGGASGDAAKPASPCTFSFHTAFDDPDTPAAAPERWSTEVRCIAVY